MSDLRDQWLAYTQARAALQEHEKEAYEKLLNDALATTDQWIAGAHDPELGDVGGKFQKAVKQSGCVRRVGSLYQDCVAEYTSFSYWQKEGFVNNITYGDKAEIDLAQLYSVKVHELSHAIQKMNSAALHASPFNPNTRIVICPRDWAMLEERCEQNSHVMQTFFNSLLAQELPAELRTVTKTDAFTFEEFEEIRRKSSGIEETMTKAAAQALRKTYSLDGRMNFHDYYQRLALNNFERGMDVRQDKYHESGWIFVRAEPEDIEAIGATLDPNCFMRNGKLLPEFLEHAPMLPERQQHLSALNQRCGITDENALPTLSEALAAVGMTRAQFIAQSYKKPALGSAAATRQL